MSEGLEAELAPAVNNTISSSSKSLRRWLRWPAATIQRDRYALLRDPNRTATACDVRDNFLGSLSYWVPWLAGHQLNIAIRHPADHRPSSHIETELHHDDV